MSAASELVRYGATVLAKAGIDSAANDSALLLAHVLDVSRASLATIDDVTPVVREQFEQALNQRELRIPLQHITGVAYFRHLELQVGPGVFVPRPETELLAQYGIDYLSAGLRAGLRAMDLCAGSGALAISLATEVPGITVFAVELSPDALPWLQKNVAKYADQIEGVGSRIEIIHGDAGSLVAFSEMADSVDVIVTNPPYIPTDMIPREPEARDFDPAVALYGGPDGLEVAREVARTAAMVLKPGGVMGMEHADVQGDFATGVPAMLSQMNAANVLWEEIEDRHDYNHLPRFTVATRSSVTFEMP